MLWVFLGCVDGSPKQPTELGALLFDGRVPRNLLVVSLDTTRRDYIGRFAGTADTPNLDAFLARSVTLDDHRSCSNWTAWSMTCVVSGRNPMQNGFATWSKDDGGAVPDLPPGSFETLSQRLTDDLGWDTVLVTSSSVFSSETGVAKGFGREVLMDGATADAIAAAGLQEASDAMAQKKPWYLHVHFLDPHGNYCPPAGYYDVSASSYVGITPDEICQDSYDDAPSYDTETPKWQRAYVGEIEELYRGQIRYWDAQFGPFIGQLTDMGALDDTLVMFVTDHGQQFYERADYPGYGGHGHGIYMGSEENRSTAAFWAANLHPLAWEGPTTHEDLAATLYAVYGVTPHTPTNGAVVGTAPPDRVLRAENFWGTIWGTNPLLSVIRSGHQMTFDWSGSKHFFKLEDDPAGVKDVYDQDDPDVVAMWPAMSDWIDEVQSYWGFLGEPKWEGP